MVKQETAAAGLVGIDARPVVVAILGVPVVADVALRNGHLHKHVLRGGCC